MRHHVTKLMPYTPDQLFGLVGDVRRYPEFVPWITGMRVWNEHSEGDGVTALDAESRVGFSFLKERFSTRVRRDAGAHRIEVSLLSGPFRRLRNVWVFEPHPVGTTVQFDIDFEFKSRLLDAMLAANFDRAANKLIACFESRAMALYAPFGGTSSAAGPAASPARP